MPLRLSSEDLGKEVLLVRARGMIDLLTVAQWEELIRRVIRRRPDAVLVDISELNHLSARGLKMLPALAANQSLLNGCLIVVGAHGAARRAGKLVGLWELASEAPSVRAALKKVEDIKNARTAGEKALKETRSASRRMTRQSGE